MWDEDAVRYLFLYKKNNVRTEKEHSNLKLITFHLLVGNADILQDAKEDVWVCQVAVKKGEGDREEDHKICGVKFAHSKDTNKGRKRPSLHFCSAILDETEMF
jgi:hypothetical protein